MFRFSTPSKHCCDEPLRDVLKTIGKLSLAGIFVAGTVLMAEAEAAIVQLLK